MIAAKKRAVGETAAIGFDFECKGVAVAVVDRVIAWNRAKNGAKIGRARVADYNRAAIGRKGRLILVEGYFDVLSMHFAGFPETVATCGTSLTPEHVARIRRLTRSVIVLLDADEAGARAAERTLPLFEEAGIQQELDVYNPLVPDGRNFKATLMIEYPDVDQGKRIAQPQGDEFVGPTRLCDAGGVIVRQNNSRCIAVQSAPQNLPWVNSSCVYCAEKQLFEGENPVTVV